jgi:hypothetical protein
MRLKQLCVALISAVSLSASAAEITFNYSFTATFLNGPQSGGPFAGPLDSLSGSFGGSFTPLTGGGTNVSVLSYINLDINGYKFTTANTSLEVHNGRIVSGGDYAGTFGLYGSLGGTTQVNGAYDFFLAFFDPAIAGPAFSYTAAGYTNSFPSVPTVMRVSPVPDSVWPLPLLSISVLGLVMISRRLGGLK